MNPILIYLFAKSGINNFINGLALSLSARTFDSDEYLEEYKKELNDYVRKVSFKIPDLTNKEILLPYLVKLTEEVTDDELNLIMNRIESVRIKRGIPNLSNVGSYDTKLNILKYVLKRAIGHEFLHLASSYYDEENDIWLCGFQRFHNGLMIGRGLTEGFTELLASRYFNKKGKPTAYTSLVEICKMLELFFDNPDDMRKCYFSCDMPKFIEKMKEYMSEEEVYNLLFEMDLEIKTLTPTRSRNIQAFLFNKFMEKCNDTNKIDKMNELAMRNAIFTYSILKKDKIEQKMKVSSVKEVLKRSAKTYYRKTGAVIAASALLFSLGHYKDKVRNPSDYAEALVNNCTEDEAFILNEKVFSTDKKTGKPVTSYDGKYLYKSIIDNNLKYCDILDEYYTMDGGEITFNVYKGTSLVYESDAEPVYSNDGKIIAYSYSPNPELPVNTRYDVVDGKLYHIDEIIFNETVLPNGLRIVELDDEQLNSYNDIELIDSHTYISRLFAEIKDCRLLCDAEKIPHVFSNGKEGTIWDIDYTLEHKKN